jgi:hypothetical protein
MENKVCVITAAERLRPTSSITIARKRAGLVASLLACVLGVMCRSGSAVEQLESYHLAVCIRCDAHH